MIIDDRYENEELDLFDFEREYDEYYDEYDEVHYVERNYEIDLDEDKDIFDIYNSLVEQGFRGDFEDVPRIIISKIETHADEIVKLQYTLYDFKNYNNDINNGEVGFPDKEALEKEKSDNNIKIEKITNKIRMNQCWINEYKDLLFDFGYNSYHEEVIKYISYVDKLKQELGEFDFMSYNPKEDGINIKISRLESKIAVLESILDEDEKKCYGDFLKERISEKQGTLKQKEHELRDLEIRLKEYQERLQKITEEERDTYGEE